LDSLPEPTGPLFGLPISTKEHHGQKGENIVSNASYVAWIGQAHGSCQLYDILWDAGCVYFARTTQPQTIMHLETNSNIYGRTLNPYNRNLTPGGSSGGESALIGMRGSLLGVGGDIGGSIRCPAAHCGIYGFKPTCKRIPSGGVRTHMVGKEAILSTLGPMTVDREALQLFVDVVMASEPWLIDPSLTVGWRKHTYDKPLKIAVQWSDGVVQPHPPMIRALKEVAAACKAAGMEVVDWDCTELQHDKAWEILSSLYWTDGGEETLGRLNGAGEPVLPLTKFIIQEQPAVKSLTQHEMWERTKQRDQYRDFYAKAWNTASKDRQIDVILCPPSFSAAVPHDQSKYWGYTAQWNLLDYPGAVFPVTTVDPEKDPKDESYTPKNAQDKFCYNLYTPETYKDAPVSLQIIGRRNHDEKVLAALDEIEKALGRS
jgi:amidase